MIAAGPDRHKEALFKLLQRAGTRREYLGLKGATFRFHGEAPGGISGFPEGTDPERYQGLPCTIQEMVSDEDPDYLAFLCRFPDGTEAVLLRDSLGPI